MEEQNHKAISDIENVIDTHLKKSEQLLEDSVDKSIECTLHALKLAEENKLNNKIGKIVLLLGKSFRRKKDFTGALSYLRSYLKKYDDQNKNNDFVNILTLTGEIQSQQNNFLDSLTHHLKAYTISRELVDIDLIITSCNSIGILYGRMGNMEKCLEYFIEAITICESQNRPQRLSSLYNNIAQVYSKMDNNEKSLEFLEKARVLFIKEGDEHGLTCCLNNMGSIFSSLGDSDKAIEVLYQSNELKKKIADHYGRGLTLINLGNIFLGKKDYDQSLKYFQESLEICRKSNNKTGEVIALQNIGIIFSRISEQKKAIENLELSIKLGNEILAKDIVSRTYLLLSQIYEKEENFKEALANYQLYTQSKDEIFNKESTKHLYELQTKYETEAKIKEAEIQKLKNFELVEANKKIHEQRDHLTLINKVLRHDLKNNLTSILSGVRIYQHNKENIYLEEVIKKVMKSNELIDKMRDLENLLNSSFTHKPFLISEIIDIVANSYPDKTISVRTLPVKVMADDTIYSIFDNIISNAFIHGQTDKIDISMEENGDNLLVRIADFGGGIPDEIKSKVFEESFKFGKTGNTGLGLFIVKKAVENYHGAVFVTDNKPHGAIFTLKLKKEL